MSVTTETPPPQPATDEARCEHCQAPLAEDQEWCLECGSARTLIHPAPDWRVPFAIIGGVILLVLVGVVLALVGLSADANRIANQTAKAPAQAAAATNASGSVSSPGNQATAATTPAPPSTPTHASTAASTAPAAPTRGSRASIGDWPVGLGGWTVVMAATRGRPDAVLTARSLAASGVVVGLLHSSQHPSMTQGYWVVFSGRYPTGAAARAAAAQRRAAGYPSAHARLVGPPGG